LWKKGGSTAKLAAKERQALVFLAKKLWERRGIPELSWWVRKRWPGKSQS